MLTVGLYLAWRQLGTLQHSHYQVCCDINHLIQFPSRSPSSLVCCDINLKSQVSGFPSSQINSGCLILTVGHIIII